MKRTVCLICIIAILASLCGCGNRNADYARPVNVYYCTTSVDYQSEKSVFASEVRDFYGWSERVLDFLNVYLSGPEESDLVSPFPAGSKINYLYTNGSTINVQLNAHFSRLSSSELTIACACLSMTIFSITSAETVNVQIEGINDGQTTITMTRENLHFTDLPTPEE